MYAKEAFLASPDSSWAAFTNTLRANFYPDHLQKKKTNKFYNLSMGTKLVQEYHRQFMELLRFIPILLRMNNGRF